MKNQSESIAELAAALSKMQGEMSAAKKDCTNPFFKSKYADLTSIWEACRIPMSSNGLCVTQTMDIIEGNPVLVTTLLHSSGQWVKSLSPILYEKQRNEPLMDDQGRQTSGKKVNEAQTFGVGVTYMRRYSLSAILGIVQDDDDGNGAFKKYVSSHQAKEIESLLNKCDAQYRQGVIQWLNAPSIGAKTIYELPLQYYEQLKNDLTTRLQANINNV